MTEPTGPDAPRFPFAEGFSLPPLDAETMSIVNEVFALEHYTSVALVDGATRERIFGDRNPQGVVGYCACNGFAIHTLVPAEGDVRTDAFVAPMPGLNETEFLNLCLDLNMPEQTFKGVGPHQIAAALDRTGIPVATGVTMAVSLKDPSVSFGCLVLPRVYVEEFGEAQSEDEPSKYGIKLTSAMFNYLTLEYLKELGQ